LGQNSHKLLRTIHPIEPADLMQLLNTVRSWTGEVQHLTKDGRQVFVESRHQAIETDSEILILETNHDITERKRAKAEMARMAAVAGASHDALFGVTLEVYIEAWNRLQNGSLATPRQRQSDSNVHVLAASADHRDQRDFLARACAGEMIPPYYAAACEKTEPCRGSVRLGRSKHPMVRLSRFRLPCMISATGRSGRRANGL